jgi:CRISPR-associated endoribonuclease Cas6
MRLNLTFRTHDLTLPLNYQHTLQGLVYHLTRADSDYSAFLHNRGHRVPVGRPYKLFCFSRLQGAYHIQGKTIIFPRRVSFSLDTADPALDAIWESVLKPGLLCRLGRQSIQLEQVQRETFSITEGVLNIRMTSPITIYSSSREEKTRFYSPWEAEFVPLINQNYRRKWYSAYQTPPPGDIALSVRSVCHRDKCVTRVKGTYITAWGGEYRLTGSTEALRFLYHTGLGGKNSMGFGQFVPD